MTVLEIHEEDAAIVLRADGTFDTSFPNLDEDDDIPDHVALGAALAFAIQNEAVCKVIFDHFDKVCEDQDYMMEGSQTRESGIILPFTKP